jgi:soluble lytic murein transglycosylase-like protein
MDWKQANDGPKWVPVLNQVEQVIGLPADLLARMAFQESSFRPAVIDGTEVSPAGALGILQLMPQYFTSTHKSIPYDDDAVKQQISDAGQYIWQLAQRFGDWGEALAAYNYGPGNEEKYLQHKITGLPAETTNYVAKILADVQLPGESA